MSTKKDEEVLFAECKESVDDVFGWKIVIFLPHTSYWKIFVMATVVISFVLATIEAFYKKATNIFYILQIICNSIYFLDVFCATLHFALEKTRKLKHGQKRLFFLLVVDYISLLPLNLCYKYLVYSEGEKSDSLNHILQANVILRIYQIPLGISFIKKTVFKMRTYFFLVFTEVILYYALLMHFCSCLMPLYFDENEKKRCLNDFNHCIVENDFLTLMLLDRAYFAPYSNFPLLDYTFLLSFEFLSGFFYEFALMTPLLIYMNLVLINEYFENSSKRKQLRMLIHNSIQDTVLKEKIQNYFKYIWTYGEDDQAPDVMNMFPLCFQKTIFCDMHWKAFMHSEFLQNISLGCKRSLALSMKIEFVAPKTKVLNIQQAKNSFIYLERGLLQIMAEENSDSALLNFSEGTVLGEISLFLQTESKAILRAGMFSVIHILKHTDLFRVLMHYPQDKKKIYQRLKLRLTVAKSVHKNRTEIYPLFLSESAAALLKLTNVKWLKHQFRTIVNLKKAEGINIQSGNRESIANYNRILQLLETQLQHTSVYFSLLNIKDDKETTGNAVCLNKSFLWALDPNCHFLFVWKIVIIVTSLIIVIFYPAFLGWYSVIPHWFFNMAVLINFICILDVYLQFITAVKIKDIVVSNFKTILGQRLSSFVFYADVLAALPLYFLKYFYKELQGPFKLNILLSNTLIKSYKLLSVMNKVGYSSHPGVFYVTMKYLILMYFSIYWSAAVFNIYQISSEYYGHGKSTIHFKRSITKGKNYDNLVSTFVAVLVVLKIPYKNLTTENFSSFLIYFIVYICLNFFYYLYLGECNACYVLDNSQEVEYVELKQHVVDFMKQHSISEMIQQRVIKTLEFHWNYNKGNLITQKRSILEEFSTDLRNETNQKLLLPILRKSQLFEWEDEDFLVDLCNRATLYPMPESSLLVTFGSKTMTMYLIIKGYIQINSFLAGDTHLNISTPVVLKTGDIFPVLVAFSQAPASVTAIALTDCEVLIIDLENILTLMCTHGIFPDIVQALKEIDLTPMYSGKLGLAKIKKVLYFQNHASTLSQLKFYKYFLKYLLIRRGIDSESTLYLIWEITRNLIILFNLILWPIVFGCCCKSESKETLIHVLLAVECTSSLVDFYLRIHISYYNKLGILVTHPLATLVHYLTSSFLIDFISFFPNFHIIYLLAIKSLVFNDVIIITHMLMRSLSLYRTVGLFSFINKHLYNLVTLTKIGKCYFFALLGLHYFVNYMTYLYLHYEKKPKFKFAFGDKFRLSHSYEYYFHELSLSASLLTNGMVFWDYYSTYTLGFVIVSGTLAALNQTFILSVITLSTMTRIRNFSIYQYYLKSFESYLKNEKVEDKISALAIKYFEFKWDQYEGVDFQKIFSLFPRTLHEDLIFPLYKETLRGVNCFSRANDAFYRALSRNVELVNIMKATDIIFEKQVQEDIFFVHKGKCYVEGFPRVLVKGAIIGDIRRCGFMKHSIRALTHVVLLKISSELFFLILENFYETKKAFELEVSEAEDFLESIYMYRNKGSLTEIESFTKQDGFVEAEFESGDYRLEDAVANTKKQFKLFFKPDSVTLRVLNFFFFMDACITVIMLPALIGTTFLSWWTFTIIYVLDIIWIVKIIVTHRTALLDLKTGNYLYSKRKIISVYLRKFDGLVLHILSVLPIEGIVFFYYKSSTLTKYCHIMYYCYSNRLLRIPYIHMYMKRKKKELLAKIYLKLLNVVLFGIALINLFVCFLIILRRGKEFEQTCHWGDIKSMLNDLSKAFFYVMNFYVKSGVPVCLPESPLEVCFFMLLQIWSFFAKTLTVNHILVIILVKQYTKSEQLFKLRQLEKYLMIRNVSPPLFQKMQKYCSNLINSYKEEAHPRFLREIPPYIRIKIMKDVYMENLENCYIFQGSGEIFLQQLAMRLKKFIFFPGDTIVEKGDVDLNMYFIFEGEVKCIELDAKYPVLERKVDLFVTGESFGVMQGIFYSCPHLNTYRANTLTDILVLNFHEWGDLRVAFPDITKNIYDKFKDMQEKPK